MITGIILRYIKTYRGYNYIPLVCNDRFCGLVGNNGVGKSSVLESLDAFFNNKTLNLNIATKKSGIAETKPHVLPIFLIKKSELTGDIAARASMLSELAIEISEADFQSTSKSIIKQFISHRDRIIESFDMEQHYLVPIGIDHERQVNLSLFNCRKLVELYANENEEVEKTVTSLNDEQVDSFSPLLQKIISLFDYIYIPKEIDSESFTKLEATEIQALMGESLTQIIEERVPADVVKEINKSLTNFLNDLSGELESYSYRTTGDRQQNLKKNDIYNLITQAFFNIRKLHRKQGDNWLEINSLSSGEKQKAIIDVAHSLIKNHRLSGDNLILAIDEPESSLHMTACFDQFDVLYDISRSCRQLLFSTHWYGFFPTTETGSASVITIMDGEHAVDLINLSNHREQVKQMNGRSRGSLPHDIRLKSINDFVQSIITSSIGDEPYNWIICEGSSDKIYLSAYFKDLIDSKKLRIIPVGGAKEIKRLYQHIVVSYKEFEDDVTGKIILISDTDPDLVNYEVKKHANLYCRRIVNANGKTELVNIDSNPVSPKTEIEDVLNGKCFYETLKKFIPKNNYLEFLNTLDITSEEPSFFALDLRASERELIERFFDESNNKVEFAREYISNLDSEMKIPNWIEEIREWL